MTVRLPRHWDDSVRQKNAYPVFLSQFVLATVYPIKSLTRHKRMPGPRWKWTDGQTMDKFLDGFACSRLWRQHGTVYRIASGTIPEV